jgi:asparagine synthase (glutamine-hydrolysing)
MCGIGGTVGGAAPDATLLERMAHVMAKRGPDGSGTWTDAVAGIVATRLAIIDLHERSDQPLHLGPLHIVFNGEIYNYRELRDELRGLGHGFETEGDAEVLLHAWAEWRDASLHRLNGMFAFAVWDERVRSLTAAVDPFGEKPFYYSESGGRLTFASELKAILLDEAVHARPDERAFAAFVARELFPAPDGSFFEGIRRLPAAHLLRWRDGRLETGRYWQPRRVEVPDDYGEAARALRGLLVDSIRLRLRSDVPVGTSLSGGLDSSAVVALSAELAGDHTRHAFTARFPGFARDEWRYAHEVAERAGVAEHHGVVPTADEALADLDRFVLDEEEPVASLSVYAQWRVMAAAKNAGVVVLLDGQGGDELFAGYSISTGFALRAAGVRTALRAASTPARARDVGVSLALDYLPGPVLRAQLRRMSSPYASPEVVHEAAAAVRPALGRWVDGADPLRRELLRQSFVTSLPQLLRYADRSSMAHSREVRLPYLDRRVAEFAFSLPAGFLYANGRSKRILRDAARGAVPDSVLDRRDKVAFEPPQQAWLDEPPFRERIAELLLDSSARTSDLADRSAVEADLARGSWRDANAIWRLVNAELWLRLLARRPAAAQAA